MKITTGMQLLEWLQKQSKETLNDKILIAGEDIPYTKQMTIQVLRQDIWYDGDESAMEWSDLDFPTEEEAIKNGCIKDFEKGGIVIYI